MLCLAVQILLNLTSRLQCWIILRENRLETLTKIARIASIFQQITHLENLKCMCPSFNTLLKNNSNLLFVLRCCCRFLFFHLFFLNVVLVLSSLKPTELTSTSIGGKKHVHIKIETFTWPFFKLCAWKRFNGTKSWRQLSKDYRDLKTSFFNPLDGTMFFYLDSFRPWFINQIFP